MALLKTVFGYKNQVDPLQEMGVSAVCLNSSLPADQYRHHVSLIQQNKAKLLYIAPESLVRPQILEMLQAVTVDCLPLMKPTAFPPGAMISGRNTGGWRRNISRLSGRT